MFHDKIGDILGSVLSGAGRVLEAALPTAIPAGLQYLAARENSQAARDIAKVKSGASGASQVVQRSRIQQGGLSLGRGFSIAQDPRNYGGSGEGLGPLAKLGIPGGGTMNGQRAGAVFDATTAVAPYIADKLGAYLFGGGGANGGNGRMNGNGAMVPYQPGHICRRPSGTVIANDLYDFYTESGNPRGTVASIADGRITYWTNRGQPVVFSRDAALCKGIRSRAAKIAHAAGHRHASPRRKR